MHETVPRRRVRHRLRILDRSGDIRIGFDPTKPAEVAMAAAQFDLFVRDKGYLAYTLVPGGGRGEQLRQFDPQAREIILAAPLVGG